MDNCCHCKELNLGNRGFGFLDSLSLGFGNYRLLEQFHLILPVYAGTERNGFKWNRSFSSQESTDSGSEWDGSKGSSINARLIRTKFGTVLFGTVLFGSSVNGVAITNQLAECIGTLLHTFESYIWR